MDDSIVAGDQAAFACDLNGAVAEHFNRLPESTGLILEYRNDRSLGVVAECLMDLVTDYESGSHGESSTPQALPPVRLMCGFFAIHKLSPAM
ncbi:hypothetical protein [Bradyrhizobium sp. AUGA SZCCT0431]|uniref:hypothetical protein n=1 Tax=Bradyrhizobium sp. AUGA SZCCT0431 TaxID=2807674 RepID=UPI001BACDFE1|nr:hypothetical protein [Bradyrhizobium sp. AUGA SZCCT0431]MBR1144268.1 hypothetical protein [Bradyrhizobium sp. AUGA SZCCT0431]